MRLERYKLRVASDHRGQRLDDVLARWLPPAIGRGLSRSFIRRVLMAGAVWVDGKPVRRPALTLHEGQVIEARIDLDQLPRPTEAPTELSTLYRDAWLLAVAKPAGLQVHASADSSRPDLFSLVRRQLFERVSDAGSGEGRGAGLGAGERAPYLALHHRLDIETSGVVLFATDPAANAGLARAFAEHLVEKVYEAITVRPAVQPPARWTAQGPLALAGPGRAARVRVTPGGQPAETRFSLLGRFRAALLVEARPVSGRKHQVRAHLADAGLPILGDSRYGGATSIAGTRVARVMLHAAALRLAHPVTGQPLHIRAPRPPDFGDLLDRLERFRGALDTSRASR